MVLVLIMIAEAQAKGGFATGNTSSFKLAQQVAIKVPAHPKGRAGDLETAHDTVEFWKASGGKPAIRIVRAWLNGDHPTEALAFARSLSDATERITALLAVAQELLNQAGAPNV